MLLKKINLILGIGRLVTTEYRVLPSIRYSTEPSNRTEYRFSPTYSTFTLQSVLSASACLIGDTLKSDHVSYNPTFTTMIYITPLKGHYSKVVSTSAWPKRAVLRPE